MSICVVELEAKAEGKAAKPEGEVALEREEAAALAMADGFSLPRTRRDRALTYLSAYDGRCCVGRWVLCRSIRFERGPATLEG